MTTLFKLLSRLPLWWLHGAGWLLGWLVFLGSATYRKRFMAHAALAGYRFAAVRAAVGHAGRMAAELPRLWLGPPVACQWTDPASLERACASGRGVVFLTPHLGCFEVTAQAMAQRYGERFGPLTVLYRPARQAWLSRLMKGARDRPGLNTAPTSLAGVRQMVRALRAGQSVGLLPDQVPPHGQGLWCSFFGRDAYTMTLSARLAQQTGATVLVAWGERLGGGRGYRVHTRALAQPLAADLPTSTLQINQEIEQLIRECPEQYLWGYARYRQPRREP